MPALDTFFVTFGKKSVFSRVKRQNRLVIRHGHSLYASWHEHS